MKEEAYPLPTISSNAYVRDTESKQTRKLINRLLQTLDDENNDLTNIIDELKTICHNRGINWDAYANKNVEGENESDEFADDGLERKFNDKNSYENNDENLQRRKDFILRELHKQEKLSQEYEKILDKQMELLSLSKDGIKKRGIEDRTEKEIHRDIMGNTVESLEQNLKMIDNLVNFAKIDYQLALNSVREQAEILHKEFES